MRPLFALLLLSLFASRAGIAQDLAPPNAPILIMTVTPPPIVAQLEAATKDLQMPSETDAPFRVVFFPSQTPKSEAKTEAVPVKTPEKLTPEALAQLAGAPADAKIETRDLDEFFANATAQEDWMEDAEKASAQRFAALVEMLKKQLQDVQVVVWGEAQKQVAIIGQIEGGSAGITTVIVET